MENNELILSINTELSLSLPEKISYEELHTLLTASINDLIKNDFEKLITYLYRIDVSEQKLKLLLQQKPGEDAGNIIATLIIERQAQKIKTRKQFSEQNKNTDTEEKW